MNSSPILASAAARDTKRPVPVETKMEGMVETRPSPMVSKEYVVSAVPHSISFCTTPIIMPPIILIKVISMPALTSPETNLQAPSMAP